MQTIGSGFALDHVNLCNRRHFFFKKWTALKPARLAAFNPHSNFHPSDMAAEKWWRIIDAEALQKKRDPDLQWTVLRVVMCRRDVRPPYDGSGFQNDLSLAALLRSCNQACGFLYGICCLQLFLPLLYCLFQRALSCHDISEVRWPWFRHLMQSITSGKHQ